MLILPLIKARSAVFQVSHRKLEQWLKDLPTDTDPRRVIREYQEQAVPIAGKAGDLVIWHSALPHGSSPNSAERPRMAQYIAMSPAPNEGKKYKRTSGHGLV